MVERLGGVLRRYEEVLRELASAETSADASRLAKLMKEQANLSPVAAAYEALEAARRDEEDSEALLSVSGTRCTRCVPLSKRSLANTSFPVIMNVHSLNPPSPLSEREMISVRQPRRSAYRVYIR